MLLLGISSTDVGRPARYLFARPPPPILEARISPLACLFTSSFGGKEFVQSPFLNWSNLSQVIRAVSYIAILAVGQAVVIIA
ncbi:MAG: hypothetical protein QXE82_02535, partial [Candidatus Nitrosotenuis sp.]